MRVVGGVPHPRNAPRLRAPSDGIGYPDAAWLRTNPEFEILLSVVVLHAVPMMDRLIWQEVPAEESLQNENVFENITTLALAACRTGVTAYCSIRLIRLLKASVKYTLPARVGLARDGPLSARLRSRTCIG